MEQTKIQRDENRRKIDNKRAELTRLRAKKKGLLQKIRIGIASTAATIRRARKKTLSFLNSASGAVNSGSEQELESVKQDIRGVELELRLIENDAQYLLNDHNRLQNSLQENARELASLNCVI